MLPGSWSVTLIACPVGATDASVLKSKHLWLPLKQIWAAFLRDNSPAGKSHKWHKEHKEYFELGTLFDKTCHQNLWVIMVTQFWLRSGLKVSTASEKSLWCVGHFLLKISSIEFQFVAAFMIFRTIKSNIFGTTSAFYLAQTSIFALKMFGINS